MKQQIHEGLNRLLADYQVFYQKLRNYHWNVTGPMFFGLHEKFEELYLDAATKVDAVAERILALDGKPVATLAKQLELARLKEDSEDGVNAQDMVRNLVSDIAALNAELRRVGSEASDSGDAATANLLDEFADGQEKTAWMLRAFLDA